MHHEVRSKSVFIDILLTVFTFGIWNIYVQIRQIHDVNELLGKEEIPSFLVVFILSVVTLGIYFCYHEYKLCSELHQLVYKRRFLFPEITFAIFTLFGLWFIVDSYQQALINNYVSK